jgi:FkbH-like protein
MSVRDDLETNTSIPFEETVAISSEEEEVFVFPLSPAQERFWILDRLQEGQNAYHLTGAIHLAGLLQADVLEWALARIIERHEILRTTFPVIDDTPVQAIHPSLSIPLSILDLQPLSPTQQEREIQQYWCDNSVRRFDLARGPLCRLTLIRASAESHILGVTLHHIISDGWSIGIFLQELSRLYRSFLDHQPFPLPELEIQYADFSQWQREGFAAALSCEPLDYWTKQLAGSPPSINLPTDYPDSSARNRPGKHHELEISPSLVRELNRLSISRKTTLFAVLLTALKILLFRWTGQEDLTVGTVVANRDRPETEGLIGCFINFLALRSRLSSEETGGQYLRRESEELLTAYSYQDYPFEKVVEALNPPRQGYRTPLYNVALLLQNFPLDLFFDASLQVRPLRIDNPVALLDLRLVAIETSEGLLIDCEYDSQLFSAETIEFLMTSYRGILETLITDPDRPIENFPIISPLALQAEKSRKRVFKPEIAIVSTFTAEPIQESLDFWTRSLELPAQIEFAPYNQVFQQLLDSSSLLHSNRDGLNVILVRVEDWQRYRDGFGESASILDPTADELVHAIGSFCQMGRVPCLLCLCPSTPSHPNRQDFQRIERQIEERLAGLENLYILTGSELLTRYRVSNYHDPRGDELGHIPYTRDFFTALGTSIARYFHGLRYNSSYKVIALDCDRTLWQGICGEDGPDGVEITEEYRFLQEFMVARQESGLLLCLCSKNSEADVWAVFKHHPSMPLQRSDVTAARLNWQAKSENLRSLARELQLGLDSFIFLDDNPIECAEVRANCPEVLTLQLPDRPELIPTFLEGIWAFDRFEVTKEDRQRSESYRQNQDREDLLRQSMTFEEFLEKLALEINIAPLSSEHRPRASQLTQRTNQFNLTTIRRSTSEIAEFCRSPHSHAWIVTVQDRFGDYGLVGVILAVRDGDSLQVDTFLLSCRVLGRGVEHRMLAWLGEIALQRGLTRIVVPYHETPKNRPALDFLDSLEPVVREAIDGGWLWEFSPETALSVRFVPPLADRPNAANTEHSLQNTTPFLPRSAFHTAIIRELSDVDSIQREIEHQRAENHGSRKEKTNYLAPSDRQELKLVEIWSEILGLPSVGIRDNFFEMGGTSLLAVRLMALVSREFGTTPPLTILFENPTIETLAIALHQPLDENWSVVVPIQTEGSESPLFCVHPAGGNVLCFFDLARSLGNERPFYGLQALGLSEQHSPQDSIEEMAIDYLQSIRAIQPVGPYYLAGWSFGGLVAYEIARQLVEQGESPSFLGLIDAFPLSLCPEPSSDRIDFWVSMFGSSLPLSRTELEPLTEEERLEYVVDRAIQVGLLPANFSIKQAQRMLQVYQANLRAGRAYQLPFYSGRVTLFLAQESASLSPDLIEECWRTVVGENLQVEWVEGDHYSLVYPPRVRDLALAIGRHTGKRSG